MRKRVFSELLGGMVPLSLTTHTLRCIDKAGGAAAARRARVGTPRRAEARPCRAGLDAYVLNTREAELGTGVGPELRQALLIAAHVRRAEAKEAAGAAKGAAGAAASPPRNAE